MAKPQGIIIYEGPSMIDGKPIVVIATGWLRCSNDKTGKMIQTWIMRSDIPPVEANKTGEDKSVCGNCKHLKWGTCYVALFTAPYQIYLAYKRGRYEHFSPANSFWFNNHKLRLGSYGDPVAVPIKTWQGLVEMADGYTGYTHQWKNCDKGFNQFVMASVDTEKEKNQARQKGWRTFRVRLEDDELHDDEFICPASGEGGAKVQCVKCLACSGKSRAMKNPTIIAHGGQYGEKKRRFIKIVQLIRRKKKYTHLLPQYKVKKNDSTCKNG